MHKYSYFKLDRLNIKIWKRIAKLQMNLIFNKLI